MRRVFVTSVIAIATLGLGAPAFACGGLIGPRGSVNLLRTTTLAAYHEGVEHYVTAFQFVGTGGGKFGSLVPLPGVPTKVERGGSWTLQRLEREVNPPLTAPTGIALGEAARPAAAEVILQTRIDALDITVLRGGALAVGEWARENGFDLPPDAPQVLDFYARRSPIFMAARFNLQAARARGVQQGDGTPVQLTIPTSNPWVPLRILSLGKQSNEPIDADVFLLTDRVPSLLPSPLNAIQNARPVATGLRQQQSGPATESLLRDLRSDKNMSWMPASSMWLTYLKLDAPASTLGYDLAIDESGAAHPSWRDAGFVGVGQAARTAGSGSPILAISVAALLCWGVIATSRRRALV